MTAPRRACSRRTYRHGLDRAARADLVHGTTALTLRWPHTQPGSHDDQDRNHCGDFGVRQSTVRGRTVGVGAAPPHPAPTLPRVGERCGDQAMCSRVARGCRRSCRSAASRRARTASKSASQRPASTVTSDPVTGTGQTSVTELNLPQPIDFGEHGGKHRRQVHQRRGHRAVSGGCRWQVHLQPPG